MGGKFAVEFGGTGFMEYPAGDAGITPASDDDAAYSTLMLAALMIGHHFAISEF